MSNEFYTNTHLLAILDNMPFMAWYKDAKGRFIAINQVFADSIGKPIDEIIGRTDFDVWPYDLALLYTTDDKEVMRTGRKKFVEEPIDDKTGGIWFETFKSPVFDEEGNVIGTIGMAKDISQRMLYQIELERQRRFIKSMIDVIPDYIFYKDKNSVYLGCNKAFAHEFIGLSEEEIIGKTDLDFVKDKELAEFFREKDAEAMSKGTTQINEETIRLADRSLADVETSKTPFFDEKGELAGLIGISRDITERKQFEQELQNKEKQLLLANKVKDQFIANMSHEIRTPMHAILGFTSFLKETAEDKQSAQYLNAIEKAGAALMNLIDDILDLSKIESGNMELHAAGTDIRELMEDIRDVFQLKAREKRIEFELSISSDVPKHLLIDEVRVRQILFNLIGNAVKFTEKGSIKVSVLVKNKDAKKQKQDLVFVVRDTGIGIPAEQQPLLFEPFKQVDGQNNKKYGGTGLGLSISKGLVTIMGGTISLESRLREGSIFTVEIPGVSLTKQEQIQGGRF